MSKGGLLSYSLSFTAGPLLVEESRTAAQVLLDSQSREQARSRLLKQRLLSSRTESAGARIVSEILPRLEGLPGPGLEIVANGTRDEVKQVLWIACCLRYTLIRNFAEGPLLDASNIPGGQLEPKAVEVFFLNEQSAHAELALVSEGTRGKLRQVLKLMLFQAGLVNDAGALVRGVLEPSVKTFMHDIPESTVWMGGLVAN